MELKSTQAVVADVAREGCTIQQDLIIRRDMVELEDRLCEYVDAPHCISVESATTGLLLALKAAEIEPGDTVLCTPFSYFATADIIALAGGVPMFVDINPNTFNIDPFCLEYVIGKCIRTRQPVPRALITADLFGLPCNYQAVEEICERYGILLIEDMAQSFGATFQGKRAGSFGRMAVASFFPTKPLGELGEGGAVFCHSAQDAQRLQSLRRQIGTGGVSGSGSHLGTIQASLVQEKLGIFDQELQRRRAVDEQYRKRLEGIVRMQFVGEGHVSACTQFVLSLKNGAARDSMKDCLQRNHIPSYTLEPEPGRQRPWSGADKVALVNAQSVAQKLVGVPIHPYLSSKVVHYICDCIVEEIDKAEADQPQKITL